jgi:hypothetical protein
LYYEPTFTAGFRFRIAVRILAVRVCGHVTSGSRRGS